MIQILLRFRNIYRISLFHNLLQPLGNALKKLVENQFEVFRNNLELQKVRSNTFIYSIFLIKYEYAL